MKIAVAIPLRSAVPSLSFSGLLGVGTYTADWAARNGHDFHPITIDQAHTCLARNSIAKTVLQDGDEWVLWCDDDSFPPHDVFPRLLATAQATGADSVAALCFQRGGDMVSPAGSFDAQNNFIHSDQPGWIDSTGFHCVLTHSRVIRGVSDLTCGKPFQQPRNPTLGELVGEDRFFWAIARQAGFRLYHDTSVESGHLFYSMLTASTRPHHLTMYGRDDVHRRNRIPALAGLPESPNPAERP